MTLNATGYEIKDKKVNENDLWSIQLYFFFDISLLNENLMIYQDEKLNVPLISNYTVWDFDLEMI